MPTDRPEGGPGGEGPEQMGREPPVIDFSAAAATRGVTEEALIQALGIPEDAPLNNGPPAGGQGRPPHGGRR
ncbi:MAG: hypothetical protein E4H08_11020 [Candidatus Atribacteria bacterium]|nr:MAG: hypothetical protein E4H08_11020 [Candidatus Atribacteria bacterium]